MCSSDLEIGKSHGRREQDACLVANARFSRSRRITAAIEARDGPAPMVCHAPHGVGQHARRVRVRRMQLHPVKRRGCDLAQTAVRSAPGEAPLVLAPMEIPVDAFSREPVEARDGRFETVGVDAEGNKHPLGVMEGATENAAVVQALLDNLLDRGLDPGVCRLFIVDGAKALRKAIRRTFGKHTPIQRCQIHKGRNIMERLPKHLHAPVRRTLRQAWEMDDAGKAEQLIRNLARRLEQEAPGVSETILEGIDEILTVVRLKLPPQLRRSLACTNIIENMMGTVRRVCRNVKHWRNEIGRAHV